MVWKASSEWGTPLFQTNSRDDQLSGLFGLLLWGNLNPICCLPGCTAESCFLIGVLMFADCRQRQISRIHQMWSCVLQPVSERCSDVFAQVSHLQEAIDPPPVSPTLHLTPSHWSVPCSFLSHYLQSVLNDCQLMNIIDYSSYSLFFVFSNCVNKCWLFGALNRNFGLYVIATKTGRNCV